jgi:hypothetical protein
MRRSIVTTAAVLTVASLLLVGCSSERNGGVIPTGLASHSTAPSGPSTTKIISDAGFKVTPSGSGAYEVHVQVFDAPKFDTKTGEISISVLQNVGLSKSSKISSGVDTFSMDPTKCGYRHNVDLIVPIVVTARALSKKDVKGLINFQLDTIYGFQPSGKEWSDFTTRISLMDQTQCDVISPGDNTLQAALATNDWTESFGDYSHFDFIMIQNGATLSPADREQLLSGLSLQPALLGPVPDGQKVKVTFLNPSQTRLLKGNHCMALFMPLDISVPNDEWTTLSDQSCDPSVFTTAQNGY